MPRDGLSSAGGMRYAPISVSGIAITYYVDDQQTGNPITNLKLDARLVAKLLTQSYALEYGQCGTTDTKQTPICDPGVKGNPVDLFSDPEFLASVEREEIKVAALAADCDGDTMRERPEVAQDHSRA